MSLNNPEILCVWKILLVLKIRMQMFIWDIIIYCWIKCVEMFWLNFIIEGSSHILYSYIFIGLYDVFCSFVFLCLLWILYCYWAILFYSLILILTDYICETFSIYFERNIIMFVRKIPGSRYFIFRQTYWQYNK